VRNLFYQMKVKLMAQEAGLVSVAVENDQIVFRFPPLPENVEARNLPPIGSSVRAGKNAYRMPFSRDDPHWQAAVLDTIAAIQVVIREVKGESNGVKEGI